MNKPQTAVGNCLDVQSFINDQPLSRYQWRVVILCFLIVFLDGLDTAAMGFIAPALSRVGHRTRKPWPGDERCADWHGVRCPGVGAFG